MSTELGACSLFLPFSSKCFFGFNVCWGTFFGLWPFTLLGSWVVIYWRDSLVIPLWTHPQPFPHSVVEYVLTPCRNDWDNSLRSLPRFEKVRNEVMVLSKFCWTTRELFRWMCGQTSYSAPSPTPWNQHPNSEIFEVTIGVPYSQKKRVILDTIKCEGTGSSMICLENNWESFWFDCGFPFLLLTVFRVLFSLCISLWALTTSSINFQAISTSYMSLVCS